MFPSIAVLNLFFNFDLVTLAKVDKSVKPHDNIHCVYGSVRFPLLSEWTAL